MRTSRLAHDAVRASRSSTRQRKNSPIDTSISSNASTALASFKYISNDINDPGTVSQEQRELTKDLPRRLTTRQPDTESTPSRKRKRNAVESAKVEDGNHSPATTPKRGSARKATEKVTVKEESVSPTKPLPRKPRATPAKRKVSSSGDIKIEAPPNWEEVYNLTKEMRSKVLAPVDTMGCEAQADLQSSPQDQRFQTLVALMLSSQTKDTVTAAAMARLRTEIPGGLAVKTLLATPPDTLNEMIGKVGFHNTKTKNLHKVAAILEKDFDGDIPDTIEGLVSLPGVGPKMAYLCMSSAWGRTEGIGVDVHVHRITNLWGWHKTNQPEETRMMLQSWLPKDKWHEINHLLVGLGQTICTPVGRRCGDCVLGQKGMCPGAVREKVKKVKVEKVEEVDDGREGVKKLEVETEVKLEALVEGEAPMPDGGSMADIEDFERTTRRRSARLKS
ncbi:MAG: DNA N-glycosylase and apurinic/apyrimidinic (AP) lyase [Bogoriella megaspora]|nr:MAG: DNA N-glycosylase and apurinic/apyrimidinic (AP) lyase [Bogoriella megaspora]